MPCLLRLKHWQPTFLGAGKNEPRIFSAIKRLDLSHPGNGAPELQISLENCFVTDTSMNPGPLLYRTSHPAMGTEYSLYLYARSREEADSIARPVFQEIDRVDGLLSNYRERSELSRINHEAFQQDVTTDPETFRFLEACLAWSERSHGAFDISVGKLMKVWKFFGASGALPS